jgi:hypothetical protein
MIDMKCPSCGAGGRIPPEKVNTRLVCKKCLRVFHVNASGASVLGEHAPATPPKNVPKTQSARETTRRETTHHDTVERFDEMAAKLSNVKIPQINPVAVAMVAGVILLSALGYWFFTKESLEKRSQELARSFLKADMKPAIDLSLPETVMDTIRWYSENFKRYNELKLLFGGQEAGVTIQVVGEPSGGTAQVDMLFSKAGMRFDGSIFQDMFQPNPSLNGGKDSLQLHVVWVKDMWGNWLLDGTQTYSGKTSSR